MFYIHSNQSMPILATYAPSGGIKIKAAALNQDLGNSFSKSIVEQKDPRFVYAIARAVTAEVPNKNWDLFPMEEIQRAYPTFVGRNIFLDHNTQSVRNAVGKIVAAELRQDDEGYTYVACLFKVDRQIHPDIAMKIEDGIIDSVSMGANVKEAECSVCHHRATRESEFCEHLANLGRYIDPYTGQPNYSINHGVEFTELSLVSVPADPTAKMHKVFNQQGGIDKTAEDQSDTVVPPSNVEETVIVDVPEETEKPAVETPANTGEYVEAINRDTGFYQLDCSSPEKADFFYYILEPYINKGIVELDVTDKTVKILFAPEVENPEKFVEEAVAVFGLTMTTGVVLPEKEAAYKNTLVKTAASNEVYCPWLSNTDPINLSISRKSTGEGKTFNVKLSFGDNSYDEDTVKELVSYLVGDDGITTTTTSSGDDGSVSEVSFTFLADKWNSICQNLSSENPKSKIKATQQGLRSYLSDRLQQISNEYDGEDGRRSELPKNTHNVANEEPLNDVDFDLSGWGDEPKTEEKPASEEKPITEEKPVAESDKTDKQKEYLALKDKLNKYAQGVRKSLPKEVKEVFDKASETNTKSEDLDLSAFPPEVHAIMRNIYRDTYGPTTGEVAEKRNSDTALKELDKNVKETVQTAGKEANKINPDNDDGDLGGVEQFNAEQTAKKAKPAKKTKRQLKKEEEEFKALLPKVNEAIAVAMTEYLSQDIKDIDNEQLKADFNKAIDDSFGDNKEFADKYRSEYSDKVIKQIRKQFNPTNQEEKKAVKALFTDKPTVEAAKPVEEAPKVDEKYEAFKTEITEDIKKILAEGISGDSNPADMANEINTLFDNKGLKNPEYSEKAREELAPVVENALVEILPSEHAEQIAKQMGSTIKNGVTAYPEDFEYPEEDAEPEPEVKEEQSAKPEEQPKAEEVKEEPKAKKEKVAEDDPDLLVKRVKPEMLQRLLRAIRHVVEGKLNTEYNGVFPSNKDELVEMAINMFGTLANSKAFGSAFSKYTPEQIRRFLEVHADEFITLGETLGNKRFGEAFYAAALKRFAPKEQKTEEKQEQSEQKASEQPAAGEQKEETKQEKNDDVSFNGQGLPEFDIGPNNEFHVKVLSLKKLNEQNRTSKITKGFEFTLSAPFLDSKDDNSVQLVMELTPTNEQYGKHPYKVELLRSGENFSYTVSGSDLKGKSKSGSGTSLSDVMNKIFVSIGAQSAETIEDAAITEDTLETEIDAKNEPNTEEFFDSVTECEPFEYEISFTLPNGKKVPVGSCKIEKHLEQNIPVYLYAITPIVDSLPQDLSEAGKKDVEGIKDFVSSLEEKLTAWATDAKKVLLTNKENKK